MGWRTIATHFDGFIGFDVSESTARQGEKKSDEREFHCRKRYEKIETSSKVKCGRTVCGYAKTTERTKSDRLEEGVTGREPITLYKTTARIL